MEPLLSLRLHLSPSTAMSQTCPWACPSAPQDGAIGDPSWRARLGLQLTAAFPGLDCGERRARLIGGHGSLLTGCYGKSSYGVLLTLRRAHPSYHGLHLQRTH